MPPAGIDLQVNTSPSPTQRPRPSQLFCQLSTSEKRSRNWRPLVASPLHICTDPSIPTLLSPGPFGDHDPASQQDQAPASAADSPDSFFLTEISIIPDEILLREEEEWARCGISMDEYREVSLDEFPIVPPRPAPSPPAVRGRETITQRLRNVAASPSITPLQLSSVNPNKL